MAKKKWIKVLIITVSVVLALAVVVVGVLFFPLKGEKHVEIWSAKQPFDAGKIQTVEKKPDEPFNMLLLTDIQTWASPSDNKKAYEQIRTLVAQTNPDLILTVGDNVSGGTTRFLVKELIEVMDSLETPWAVVFGNHDDEIPMTPLNWQGDQYMKSKYCLFQKGPSNLYGCGNYVINITENGKPVQSLFMFDNGRYMEYDDGTVKEVYMGYEQIAWYEWNVKGIAAAAGHVVPSMTFSHFALPQFRQAVEEYGVHDEETGSYTIPAQYGYGKCAYLPGAPLVDSGFFDKCKELGSTRYIFCGHDHENNASVTYDGITMTYGLKTGPSPKPWNSAEKTGGTLITLGNADSNYAVQVSNIVLD